MEKIKNINITSLGIMLVGGVVISNMGGRLMVWNEKKQDFEETTISSVAKILGVSLAVLGLLLLAIKLLKK